MKRLHGAARPFIFVAVFVARNWSGYRYSDKMSSHDISRVLAERKVKLSDPSLLSACESEAVMVVRCL